MMTSSSLRIACALVPLALSQSAQALTFGTFGSWDSQARRDAAIASMTAVCNRFNAYGDFNWGSDGYIDVYYNAGVGTAQASWYGAMTFGGTWPNERVSLHETNHWLGSVYGHDPNGARAIAILEQFDGVGARYGNDGTHFWPYGMNYDNEWSEVAAQRNIAIMYAFRRDWGIGNPNDPAAWAATNVSLTGSDAVGESGFNFGNKWSDNTFAHYNANYSTGAYAVRTPQGYPSWTFAGKSLTINTGGQFLYNSWGTNGLITVNDLVLAGGTVKHDQFQQDLFQLAGKVTLAAGTTSTLNAANGNIRVLAPITGTGGLTSQSSGSFVNTLSGANTYTGATTVSTGTLAFTTSQSNIGSVNVVSGATLRVQSVGANKTTLNTTSLTAGTTGTSTLSFDLSGQEAITAPLITTGLFTANGTVNVSFLNAGLLTTGTHPLIGYAAFAGSGVFPTGPLSLGPRTTGLLVNNGVNALNLNVTADRPIWTGGDNGNWVVGTTGVNRNWMLQTALTTTNYLAGDNVLFDDTATGPTAINISAASVAPAGVTFNNSNKTYTVSSSGGYGITGTTGVTKNGTGLVTLATANSYTGTTSINAGTLSISANNNLGADAAPVTLNGGTLRTTAAVTNTHPVTVGPNGGTINVTTSGQYFFDTANTLLGSGPLTLTGTGTLTQNVGNLRVARANSYSGAVTITNGGIFEYGTNGAVAPAATFNIASQGELAIQGGNATTFPNAITANSGNISVLSFENGTAGNVTGNITLNGALSVGLRDWYNRATVRGGTISGKISGGAGLLVNSGTGTGGTLTLTNANTHSGGTKVDDSTLLLGSNTAAGTGTLSLRKGALGTTVAATIANQLMVEETNTIGWAGQVNNITLTGSLRGAGTINNALGMSSNTNVFFLGNLSLFTGTLAYTCDSGTATQWWRFGANGTTTDLSNASVVINKGNLTNLTTVASKNLGFTDNISGATLKIGALSGDGVFQASFNNAGPNNLEVGAKNTNATFSGVLAGGNAGTKINLKKVGTGTLTLTGANVYTGTTTVAAGTLRMTTPAYNNVMTNAGGLVMQAGTAELDYTGGSSPVSNVKTILTAGYAGNFAAGQIRGQSLPAGQTIGYGDNGTVVTVRVTLPGDAELDGDVDFNDFLVLQNNFGVTGTRFDQANFNYDNVTDFNDFLALQNFFGQSVSGDAVAFSDAQVAALTAFAASPLNQAVPEPASLTLIGLGAAGVLGRRRRAV